MKLAFNWNDNLFYDNEYGYFVTIIMSKDDLININKDNPNRKLYHYNTTTEEVNIIDLKQEFEYVTHFILAFSTDVGYNPKIMLPHFNMTYTEEDMREAYNSGFNRGHSNFPEDYGTLDSCLTWLRVKKYGEFQTLVFQCDDNKIPTILDNRDGKILVVDYELDQPISVYDKEGSLYIGRYDINQTIFNSVKEGINESAKETMDVLGYNVIAEGGFVVKLYKDGSKEIVKKIN